MKKIILIIFLLTIEMYYKVKFKVLYMIAMEKPFHMLIFLLKILMLVQVQMLKENMKLTSKKG